MIVVDTSAILALCNSKDSHHQKALAIYESASSPLVIPVFIMGEIAYMLETILDTKVLGNFLSDIDDGIFLLDQQTTDCKRVRELCERYADLPLGFADASVIACAERYSGKIFCFNDRDFSIVAREGKIQVLT